MAQLRRLYDQTRAQLQASERERAALAERLARRPIAERLYGESEVAEKTEKTTKTDKDTNSEELKSIRAQLAEAVSKLREMTARNRALLEGQRKLEEAAHEASEKEKSAREALENQLAGERAVVDRLLSDQERLATENEELRAKILDLQNDVFAAREAASAATTARDARAREAADLRLQLQEVQIKLNATVLENQGPRMRPPGVYIDLNKYVSKSQTDEKKP